VSRDPRVVRTDGPPGALELGSNLGIVLGSGYGQRQHMQHVEQCGKVSRRLAAAHADRETETQLAVDDDGERALRRESIQAPRESRRSLLQCLEADEAVEQVSDRHHNGSTGSGG